MAQDIQALAEELAKLNKNSTLWAQPQIQQSGAAAMMTQNQVQLQPYMNATPGAMGPAAMQADPRAANYALQQQLFLNPYRAQAYGGEFNSMLPGAEYATSSRFGIYRPGSYGSQDANMGQSSFIGDTTALIGYKSYAGYQDPYSEQINASRRMTQRFEQAAVGTMELGGLAASTYLGGALGLATGAVGAPALAFGASQYFARRSETGQIHNVMQDLVSGTAASGPMGRGVGMRTASEMMLDMRRSAASDPTKSLEDIQSVFETGAATGLFGFEGSGDKIMSKVKQASKMVNTMMMLAEDPDIQSTVKRMADFQNMGVSLPQMERMATDMRGFAGLANTSFENVMTQGGAMGAQQAQMMGGSAAFGMRVGGLSQGMANRMMQSGVLTPEQAALRGGKSGITQSLSGLISNELHSVFSTQAGAFTNPDGSIDDDALQKVMTGNVTGNVNAAISGAGRNLYDYHRNAEDSAALAESKMTPLQMITMLQGKIKNEAAVTGLSQKDYISGKYGKMAKDVEYLISDENKSDVIMAQFREQERKTAQQRNEAKIANFPMERAARFASETINDIFDSEVFGDIGDYEDRAAAAASGGLYRPGRTDLSYLSKSAQKRFAQSAQSQPGYNLATRGSGIAGTGILGGKLNTNLARMKANFKGDGFEKSVTKAFDAFSAISEGVITGGAHKGLSRDKKAALEEKVDKLTDGGFMETMNLAVWNTMENDEKTEVMRYVKYNMDSSDRRSIAISNDQQAQAQAISNVALLEDDRSNMREFKKELGDEAYENLMQLTGAGYNVGMISNIYSTGKGYEKLSESGKKDYDELIKALGDKDISKISNEMDFIEGFSSSQRVTGADAAQSKNSRNNLLRAYAQSVSLSSDPTEDKAMLKLLKEGEGLDFDKEELTKEAKSIKRSSLEAAMSADSTKAGMRTALNTDTMVVLLKQIANKKGFLGIT